MTISAEKFMEGVLKLDGKPYFWGNPSINGGPADSSKFGGSLNYYSLQPLQPATLPASQIKGADCSGVPLYGAIQAGLDGASRFTSTTLARDSNYLSVEDALATPGNLLFLKKPGAKTPYHVEVSVGDGKNTIGARTKTAGIKIRSWSGLADYMAKKSGHEAFGGRPRFLAPPGEQPTTEALVPAQGPSTLEEISGPPLWVYGAYAAGAAITGLVVWELYKRYKGRR